MKRTAAFCIFLLLLSSLLAEGYVPLNLSKKKWIKQVNSYSNLVHFHYWCMSNESFFWVYLTPRVKFRFSCGFRYMIRLWILTQNLHRISGMAKAICRLVSRITVPCLVPWLVSSECCWEVASVWMIRFLFFSVTFRHNLRDENSQLTLKWLRNIEKKKQQQRKTEVERSDHLLKYVGIHFSFTPWRKWLSVPVN